MELALAALFVTAFVTGLSGAASPGPMLTWNVAAAARHGARVGYEMVLGHAAVEFPLVVLLAVGLGALFRDPRVLGVLALLGAGVLFWLAVMTLRSVPSLPDPLTLRDVAADPGGRFREAFSAGALLSVGNPFWVLWWATIGAGLVARSLEFGAIGLMVFFAGHIASDFGWYGLVSFAMARGVRLISRRVYQGLIAFLGLAMAVLGVFFLLGGIERLLA